METINPTLGFPTEPRMSRVPDTPPYTPVRNTKRRLEHSNSPASSRAASVHPAETVSPAKKVAKRSSDDTIRVEELAEGDVGYVTDTNVVYPDELEEINSDSDDEWETASDISDPETTTGLSREFSQLFSASSPEADFEILRQQRHRHRRTNSRVYKRSHSQSVRNEMDVSDVDAMADHDVAGSQRRLRRRTRGPQDAPIEFAGFTQNVPEPANAAEDTNPTVKKTAAEAKHNVSMGVGVSESKNGPPDAA